MASGKLQRAIEDETERRANGAVAAPADAATGTAPEGGKPRKKRRIRGKADDLHGPSPNPATNLVIADIALRGGAAIARRAVEHALLRQDYAPKKAASILKGRSLGESLVQGLLARVALTSVPGAIVVVGGLAAKTLYDRSRARKARARGELALAEMAEDGKEG
ncbi:hypothetical protein EDF56_104547 [Novosphingobium sp. PhB165]|uniref:hypothetical protein n=1 Tax=Novosphingobium sp. PhB165 TaxID=2485105 RepID=UPI00104C3663|nr:hypothetical protein [Novosphingobium sp. PhB165]TCM19012.1 hypothetical protein EDF56_104547 [Novosphingobium sp. PhB165]